MSHRATFRGSDSCFYASICARPISVDKKIFGSVVAVDLVINLEVQCLFSGVNLPAVNLM